MQRRTAILHFYYHGALSIDLSRSQSSPMVRWSQEQPCPRERAIGVCMLRGASSPPTRDQIEVSQPFGMLLHGKPSRTTRLFPANGLNGGRHRPASRLLAVAQH